MCAKNIPQVIGRDALEGKSRHGVNTAAWHCAIFIALVFRTVKAKLHGHSSVIVLLFWSKEHIFSAKLFPSLLVTHLNQQKCAICDKDKIYKRYKELLCPCYIAHIVLPASFGLITLQWTTYIMAELLLKLLSQTF